MSSPSSPSTWPPVAATLRADGTADVTISGHTTPIHAPSLDEARSQVVAHIATTAAKLGRPVQAEVTDPDGVWPLVIHPDATVTEAATPPRKRTRAARPVTPAPSPRTTEAPSPAPEPATTWEQAAPATPTPAEEPTWTPQPPADPEPEAHPAPAHAQAPAPEDPEWTARAGQPATQGARGRLNRTIGTKLAPSAAELTQRRAALDQEREQRAREQAQAEEAAHNESRRVARQREQADRDRAQRQLIQTNFEDAKTVSFMNEKGGVGKTTDTYCVGATFGRIRGGDVIAWDANETRGTLGFRAQKDEHHHRSVVDLLEEAAEQFGTVEGSRRPTIMRYTRPQGDNQFGVIASDESRDRQDLVDGDGFRTVHEILGRFHSIVLIDTGNNHRVTHFKAALEATDQLVVPVSAGADGAYAAEVMLDNFTHLGHDELVHNAVVLLHDSATRRGDAGAVAQRFESRVRAIIPIPFDPALDSGGEIDFEALQPATRTAYQEAAAAIAQGLAQQDHGDAS